VRNVSLILIPAFLLLTFVGCGGGDGSGASNMTPHEEFMVKTIATLRQLVEKIETLNNPEEIQAAIKDMEAEQLELQKLAETLGEPTAEEADRLKEKYGEELEELMGRMTQALASGAMPIPMTPDDMPTPDEMPTPGDIPMPTPGDMPMPTPPTE